MQDFKKLKAENPTQQWKEYMPLFARLFMSKGINDVNRVLTTFINDLENLKGNSSKEEVMTVVEKTIHKLNEIDNNREIIETLEREDLCEFIHKGARLAGLQIGEREDITEAYRNW